MVHDSLWKSAGLGARDFICRPCFEKRIGRPLDLDSDLTLCPLNFYQIDEFGTEDRYRKLYAQSGLDYDKTKAEYFERCARLGAEPRWRTAETQAVIDARHPPSALQLRQRGLTG
jgi:hypothetical protein